MKVLRLFRGVLLYIFQIISYIFIIDWFSYIPVIYAFKATVYLTEGRGKVGPFKEVIENVSESPKFAIDAKGCPSAYLTFYRPKGNDEALPVILFVHGGSWCGGSAKGVSNYCKVLASKGYLVAGLDYSLAPAYKFPVSTVQTVEALNFLYENADKIGADRNHIFIAGNSAGGALASQAMGIVYDEEYAANFNIKARIPKRVLVGALLFDGVYNLEDVRASHFPLLRYYVWCYTGKRKYWKSDDVFAASGINGVNRDYPEIFLTVGDMDPLHGQTLEYIYRLMANDVDYMALLWHEDNAGLGHDYFLDLRTEEALIALEAATEYLEKHRNV